MHRVILSLTEFVLVVAVYCDYITISAISSIASKNQSAIMRNVTKEMEAYMNKKLKKIIKGFGDITVAIITGLIYIGLIAVFALLVWWGIFNLVKLLD